MDPALLSLLAALFGGAGLKVVDHYFGRRKTKVDDAARIRDELRLEINSQKEEIAKLEVQRDEWQIKYFDLRDEVIKLKSELDWARRQLPPEPTGE